MRTLTANALAKIQTDLGTEPILVVEVRWGGGVASGFYADKGEIGTVITGRILEVSGLDEVIQISGGGQTTQISVKLADPDGAIKTIFDSMDVHKKPVRVWQWFSGLSFNDKFLVFSGQINSPVVWSEGERTFTFTIVNRIEDVEVGFSAEEGQFPILPEDLIGKPWPLCFGQVVNVPALRAVPARSGTLQSGVGIKDFTMARRITLANKITCPQTPVGFRCTNHFGGGGTCSVVFEPDGACIQARCVLIEKLNYQYAQQAKYEYRQITILGGEKFPQGQTITLNIGGGLFTGKFIGTAQVPSNVFNIASRRHPKDDGTGQVKKEPGEQQIKTKCEGQGGNGARWGRNDGGPESDYADSIFGPLWTGANKSRLSWEAYNKEPVADFFWAAGGSAVTQQGGNEITYIANILPSTILRVAAYRTINGNRYLMTVPDEYFDIRQTNYTNYQVMEIVFDRPLSRENQESGGGWEDQIYVTLISSVGPNTVDILRWFIDTYTDYSVDNASFNAVRAQVENYPMHFPLLERKNILTVLKELANKARCDVWLRDNTFFIKYLSAVPTPVATITEDDIILDLEQRDRSLSVTLTKTEDLVTNLKAKWVWDYAVDKPNTLILRHNQKIYGVHERTENYYPYNILDLVRKSLTYWLIRWSYTWKIVRFATPLKFLNLEANDAITLDLPDVADGPFTGIVQKAVYDSARKLIDFEVWTPIRSGTRTPYDFAWPASVNEQALFPSIEERNAGLAGSGTEPNFSTIAPPNHPLRIELMNVITGIGLKCNGDAQDVQSGFGSSEECRQDHGDKKPSDEGDEKPDPPGGADNTGDVNTGSNPVANGAGTGYFSGQQQLKEENDRNGNNANEARETAERNSKKSGTNDPINPGSDQLKEMLEDLPEPEDVDDEKNPCQVTVSTFYFNRQMGPGVCTPGQNKFETYVFNSCNAAKSFAAAMSASSNCSNQPPCDTPCKGAQYDKNCKCEPPEGDDPGVVGYSGGGDMPPIMGI